MTSTPSGRRRRRKRRWEELGRDLLVIIFGKLGVAELVAGVPFTCSAWREASRDPTLWRHLDFGGWDDSILPLVGGLRHPNEVFAGVLELAVSRGDGLLETIWFPHFANEVDLLYVAERCPKLSYFYMENADVSVERFCEAVGKIKFLKGMAVHESLICEGMLQQVAKCCIFFSELRILPDCVDFKMALVICNSLPHLRKLELNDCEISRRALLIFLDELKDLEYLDISGQNLLGITSLVLEKASRLKVFRWDSEFDQELKL